MKTITVMGKVWPDTGRTFPVGAKLEIHNIHPAWLDLVWWNGNNWQYISTLPA